MRPLRAASSIISPDHRSVLFAFILSRSCGPVPSIRSSLPPGHGSSKPSDTVPPYAPYTPAAEQPRPLSTPAPQNCVSPRSATPPPTSPGRTSDLPSPASPRAQDSTSGCPVSCSTGSALSPGVQCCSAITGSIQSRVSRPCSCGACVYIQHRLNLVIARGNRSESRRRRDTSCIGIHIHRTASVSTSAPPRPNPRRAVGFSLFTSTFVPGAAFQKISNRPLIGVARLRVPAP